MRTKICILFAYAKVQMCDPRGLKFSKCLQQRMYGTKHEEGLFVHNIMFHAESGVIPTLNIGSLLAFITKLDHTPPMGFANGPEIFFDVNYTRMLPIASNGRAILSLSLNVLLIQGENGFSMNSYCLNCIVAMLLWSFCIQHSILLVDQKV